MSSLTNEQKTLLFEHALGLTCDTRIDHAETLISTNKEAAQVYRTLRSTLSPLDSLEPEPCPDDLAERTISRLTSHAQEAHGHLERLLASEQSRTVETVKLRSWRNFGEMAAIAAAIVLVASVLIPSLSIARQRYWVQQCQKQMGSIFSGLSSYISDHDGQAPCASIEPGTYWYKVGYQGEENLSSTRPMWMLVKLNYAKPTDFVCPGRSDGRALQINTAQARNYCDFPARRYVTYSPRIRCTQSGKISPLGPEPLLSDSNPIFEDVNAKSSRQFIRLSDDLMKANSRNHRGHGQNILSGDGSAQFSKVRFIGSKKDDIFTTQTMSQSSTIEGYETPASDSDFFFAP